MNKIENLPVALQSLHLNETQVNKIEKLPDALLSLHLWNTQVSKIENLPDALLSLHLGNTQVSKIENLSDALQSLNLIFTKVSKIENLPDALQSLNLSNTQVSKIENLPDTLRSLNLNLTHVSKIENLPDALQSLHLSLTQVSKIENLPDALQSLHLWSTQVSKIENLPDALQSLHLWHTQVSKIENLPIALQSLNLGTTQVNKIENLPNGLKTLYLSNTHVNRIESLPNALQSLHLGSTQVSKIENLPLKLANLYLSECPISILVLEQFPLELNLLSLRDCPIAGIPSEILRGQNTHDENCLPDLKAWFADLARGGARNKQIKLMISGNGNVGKSSVLEALKNGKCLTEMVSTHAITLDELPLNDIQFKVWDFGGQEIFHGTHRMFLTSKAINLVVFDRNTEQLSLVPDRINPHELTRNHKISYWYKTIKDLNKESPIIIAQNKCDRDGRDVASATFAAEKGCEFYEISATAGKGIGVLKAMLEEKSQLIVDYNMEMPASWLALRTRIADNLALPENKRQRLIDHAQFSQWCEEAGVLPTSEQALLRYLHHTGNLYQSKTHLKDTLILDQLWALEGIYTLLKRDSPFYQELRNGWKGKVQAQRLFSAWGDRYTPEEKHLFLSFLESCGQCFNQSQASYQGENDWYIFPEFLDSQMDPNAQDAWEEHSKVSDTKWCHFRYRHEFLHFYRIQQIIIALGRKTNTRNIWRNGIQVHTSGGWLRITANYEENALEVCMEEAVKSKWLKEIIELVQDSPMNDDWKKHLSAWEEKMPEGDYVPVKEIELNTIKEVRIEKRTEEAAAQNAAPPPPKTLAEQLPDNRKKEIMVAYAKEYTDELEMLRTYFGSHKDKFEDLWYDKELTYDEAWQKQILYKIKTCDGIILLAGPDYLHPDKKFIHEQELPAIIKRFEEDKVPVACISVMKFVAPVITDKLVLYDKAKVFRRLPTGEEKEDFMLDFIKDFVEKHFSG